MKKLVLLSICSALSLSVFSTGFTLNNKTEKKADDDHAVIISEPNLVIQQDKFSPYNISLINKMDSLAESDDYISSVSSSEELLKIINKIGQASYNKPKAIYKSVVPNDILSQSLSVDSTDSLSSDTKNIIENKCIAAIPNRVNGANGASELAATSVVSVSESIVSDDIKEPIIYFYLYDNEYSAIITVIPGSDGAASASASFVRTDYFKGVISPNGLSDFFKTNLNLDGFSFKEVSTEK